MSSCQDSAFPGGPQVQELAALQRSFVGCAAAVREGQQLEPEPVSQAMSQARAEPGREAEAEPEPDAQEDVTAAGPTAQPAAAAGATAALEVAVVAALEPAAAAVPSAEPRPAAAVAQLRLREFVTAGESTMAGLTAASAAATAGFKELLAYYGEADGSGARQLFRSPPA